MKLVPALLVIACGGAPPQPARTGPPLACELRDYTITAVRAYAERDPASKIGTTRARGAELFVEAQPSLTAEWLQLQLGRHLDAERRSAPTADCPLDVDDAKVTVHAEGPGYLVRIRGDNDDAASEILRRARALAR